uniref:Si:dkeyp-115e12.6 n=1 Tax=Scleropages formosus TaxID=113540 RepID=A0A8C9R3Y4_SCLFO
MSWVTEDWTAGLSGRALQKVRQLEAQLEQLKREKQQRQIKLDSAETALSKEKVKYDEVRSELVALQRELQSTREEAQAGLQARERLSQELQVKQAQVCSLEGQLGAARTLTNTLTQEVKRLEAELEKLENASSSGDSALFSTPCSTISSSRDHGSRWEERDRHKGNTDIKAQHIRQLQFSNHSPRLPVDGVSSPPQPYTSTPVHRTGRQLNSSTPSAIFPWEQDDAPSIPRGSSLSLSQPRSEAIDPQSPGDCRLENNLRKENDDQQSVIQELRAVVLSLKQEVRVASEQRHSSEARLLEVQDKLSTREHTLTRTREELSRISASLEKESNRAQAAEQRVKQLQEELSCQRQNAESSRLSAEQSRKKLEKEHQRELLELQRDIQAMERQQQQEISRLKQEVQQAQALHNTLQAQCDKILLQKQAVEKELDTVKGKQQCAEKELQESRRAEAQIQAKLTEALREKDSLAVSREQSERRAKGVEEEVKRLTQELNEALKLLAELQAQHAAPATPVVPARFTPAGDCFPISVTAHHERPHRPLLSQKKGPKQDGLKEEQLDERASSTDRARYPTDREPGEGIDANDMVEFGSKTTTRSKGEGERRLYQDERDGDIKEECKVMINQYSTCDIEVSENLWNNTMREKTNQEELEQQGLCRDSQIKDFEGKQDQCSLQDLKIENLALCDALKEAKQELELRLEDLETQRRAETEARTKLKQVCRKHSSQVEQLRKRTQELRDESGKLEKQLEEEQAETARLREALATLEQRSREVEEWKETERDMKEQNASLRVEIEELKLELKKERDDREKEKEDRRKEEEARRQAKEQEVEARRAFADRITELEAELQGEKKRSGENDEVGDAPLGTLLLMGNSKERSNDNSNTVFAVDGILPSSHDHSSSSSEPHSIKHKMYCTNTQGPELKTEGNLESPLRRKEKQAEMKEGLYSEETVQLLLEVECLRAACKALQVERDREASQAKQAQSKLETLQGQVTSQTKQLTLAFERQSCHIEDLLKELNDRDNAILTLEGELQHYQGQIDALKSEKHNVMVQVGTDKIKSMENVMVTPDCQGELAIIGNKVVSSMLEDPELLQPVITSLSHQGLCDDSADLQNLERALCDLRADSEELKGKLDACVSLKKSGEVGADKSGLTEDMATQRLAEEFKAVQTQVVHEKTANEKCQLAVVTCGSKQEQQCLDSTIQQSSVNDDENVGGVTKRYSDELHPAERVLDPLDLKEADELMSKNKEVTEVRQQIQQTSEENKVSDIKILTEELYLIKLENKELKLKLQALSEKEGRILNLQNDSNRKSTDRSEKKFQMNQDRLFELHQDTEEVDSSRSQQSTVVTSDCESIKDRESKLTLLNPLELGGENKVKESISADGRALHQSSVLVNTDGIFPDVQECVDTINALVAENRKLRSWAFSVCPPDKWGEIPAITEGLQKWMGCLNSGGDTTHAAESLSPALVQSTAAEEVVLSEERKDTITQRSLEPSSAQSLVPETSGLNLETADAQVAQMVNECHDATSQKKNDAIRLLDDSVIASQARESLQKHKQEAGLPVVSSRMSARELEEAKGVQASSTQTGLGEDKHKNASPQIKFLEQQLLELQSQLSILTEVNQRQAEELEVWKMTGDSVTPEFFEEPTIHTGKGSVVVQREDHLLLSCQVSAKYGHVPENPQIKAVVHRDAEFVREVAQCNVTDRCHRKHVISGDQEDTRESIQLRPRQQAAGSPLDPVKKSEYPCGPGKEVRSMGTQTEDMSHILDLSVHAGAQEMLQIGTQTEPENLREQGNMEAGEESDNSTESPPLSSAAASKLANRALLAGSFPFPVDPAHLAERIRRHRSHMSAAFDDTEYEPYGLPEVVMKGFADIPSGPACPYVLRRGLLGTSTLPLVLRQQEEGDRQQAEDELEP